MRAAAKHFYAPMLKSRQAAVFKWNNHIQKKNISNLIDLLRMLYYAVHCGWIAACQVGNPFSTHSEWWVCAWEMTCIPCAAVRPQQWEPGSPIPLGVRPSATYGAMMCNQVRSSATWLLLTSQPSQPSQPSQLLQLSQPPCGCAVYCCLCLSQRHFLQSAHRANLQRDHRAVPKMGGPSKPEQATFKSGDRRCLDRVWTVFAVPLPRWHHSNASVQFAASSDGMALMSASCHKANWNVTCNENDANLSTRCFNCLRFWKADESSRHRNLQMKCLALQMAHQGCERRRKICEGCYCIPHSRSMT